MGDVRGDGVPSHTRRRHAPPETTRRPPRLELGPTFDEVIKAFPVGVDVNEGMRPRALDALPVGGRSGLLEKLQHGAEPLVFVVHWGSGNVSYLPDFDPAFPEERAVIGIRSRGLYGEAAPLTSVTAMARAYADQLLAQADGRSFDLVGICSGAGIATHMAAELARGDRPPRKLVLVNALRPDFRQFPSDWTVEEFYRFDLLRSRRISDEIWPTSDLGELVSNLAAIGYIDASADESNYFMHKALWATNVWAGEQHRPEVYRGDTTVVLAPDLAEYYESAWQDIAPGCTEVVSSGWSSAALMADPVFASALA